MQMGGKFGILADDMGLGKTGTALLTARIHKATDPDTKIVVIAPKSLGINWRKEAKIFGATIDAV